MTSPTTVRRTAGRVEHFPANDGIFKNAQPIVVAHTHHSLRSAASRRAAAAPRPAGKQRKTGRPRARHARELHRRQRAQRDQHVGDHRRAGDRAPASDRCRARRGSRSSAPLWPARRRDICRCSARRRSAANTSRVDSGTFGIDQHRRQRRESAAAPTAAPRRPRMMRAREARQTGTSAPTASAALSSRGSSAARPFDARQQPQGRGRIGRAAADAGRHRQLLVEQETSGLEPAHARAQRGAPP